ncbi:16S rRNA (guanine(966)-N(2))-methyltransferase RsmD [Leucobacter insecticola]|uniref:16S rRNA (Guanine(966)-N(2))-methyltransferase RsmD n=1 Tax=Leucobacter insecticola TaxID=2714934 RepID=A0A6G8FJQ7_9MICO|nr:16S rRNA (guanine(966)-N(2))-methyltransferase RsmD [Leucobacter insecticola]QIM16700.1 16S rRNA (guanine(966)-N(2))-methyltransferase RsmD [Leucobacter insecticola]
MTRIIAGAAGSLRLEVPKSGTRPTSGRVREAIFSTLDSWGFTDGTRVLDLYAGSGALGLEALSRGASEAVLVEKHPQAAQVADQNAKKVLAAIAAASRAGSGSGSAVPRADVIRQSVQSFLDAAPAEVLWDVALLDPPYDLVETELAANLTALAPILTPDAVVLVERDARSPEPSWPAALTLVRKKAYGDTVLWWAEPAA